MNGPAFSSLNFCHRDLSRVCVSAMKTAAKRRFRASAKTKSPVISYLSNTDWISTTSEATYSLSSNGKVRSFLTVSANSCANVLADSHCVSENVDTENGFVLRIWAKAICAPSDSTCWSAMPPALKLLFCTRRNDRNIFSHISGNARRIMGMALSPPASSIAAWRSISAMAADESRAVNVCPLSRSAASNSCSRYCAGLFIDSSFLFLLRLVCVVLSSLRRGKEPKRKPSACKADAPMEVGR